MPTRISERGAAAASGQRGRPRKAPKQVRSASTVEAIVEAAARILEEQGHTGFSTNAVAIRAGVSIGSLYQYFPRKDALISSLIIRETAQLIAEAEMAVDVTSGRDGILVLIRACVAHQFRRPALARLLDFEEARLPVDVDTLRISERFVAIVEQVLRRSDVPLPSDPGTAARDVAALMKGIIDAAGREDDDRLLDVRVAWAVFGYLAGTTRLASPMGCGTTFDASP